MGDVHRTLGFGFENKLYIMKRADDKIQKEIEKTLEEFSAEEALQLNPFFTTRVMAHIEREANSTVVGWWYNVLLKPAIAAGLILFNMSNLYLLTQNEQLSSENELTAWEEVVAEYQIDDNDTYEYY